MFEDIKIRVCGQDCQDCPEFDNCQEPEVSDFDDDNDEPRANREDYEVDSTIDYYDPENDLY